MTDETTANQPDGGADTAPPEAEPAWQPRDLVATAEQAQPGPRVRIGLGAGDRPLVRLGERIAAGDAIVERLRDPVVEEVRLGRRAAPPPGSTVEAGVPLDDLPSSALRFAASGRTLHTTSAGVLRAVTGRHVETVASPAAGVIETLGPTALTIRAEALGLTGVLAVGDPTNGRLVIAVRRPDDELPVTEINVGAAGTILVAGGRIDVEALTRARAMGVRGVIVGGVVGHDLRSFAASEARQRASLHASQSFVLLVLDGFGKRPIPPLAWALLLAAEGTDIGIGTDPPMALLQATTVAPPSFGDRVRVVADEDLDRTGRIVEIVGRRRLAAGALAFVARVALDGAGPGRPAQVRQIALADLERLGP
ncbi:MAG: hypothetical protein ACRDF7_06565 [Candidatus Limnocylindrales bacterium]